MRNATIALLVLSGLIINARRSAAQDFHHVRDSAGVEIVENVRSTAAGAGRWATLKPEPTVSIGQVSGSPPYLFTGIVDAFESADGEIFVVDASLTRGSTKEIRVFDQSGRHLRTFGGSGEGPGEFRGEPVVHYLPPDTLLAWDYGALRLTWFKTDGRILKDVSFVPPTGTRPLPPILIATKWQVHSNGTVVVAASGDVDETPGPDFRRRDFPLIIASRALVQDSIQGLPELPDWSTDGASYHPPLFPSAQLSWAVGRTATSIFVAEDPNGRWSISEYSLNGTLERSFRAPIPRRPITDDLARAAERAEAGRVRPLSPMPVVGDSAPAIGGLSDGFNVLVDVLDRLWVKRWRGWWESDRMDIYDVLTADGVWIGWIEIPTNASILYAGESSVLLATEDALGVPRLRRYRLALTGAN